MSQNDSRVSISLPIKALETHLLPNPQDPNSVTFMGKSVSSCTVIGDLLECHDVDGYPLVKLTDGTGTLEASVSQADLEKDLKLKAIRACVVGKPHVLSLTPRLIDGHQKYYIRRLNETEIGSPPHIQHLLLSLKCVSVFSNGMPTVSENTAPIVNAEDADLETLILNTIKQAAQNNSIGCNRVDVLEKLSKSYPLPLLDKTFEALIQKCLIFETVASHYDLV